MALSGPTEPARRCLRLRVKRTAHASEVRLGGARTRPTSQENFANVCATARYTSRRNGTTRSATRSSRSQRQASNSVGWPLRGVSGSISLSAPVKRNANHFCR